LTQQIFQRPDVIPDTKPPASNNNNKKKNNVSISIVYLKRTVLSCSHSSSNKYRRLISKSAFIQFLVILTFLHIWKNESQGYLKMQGQW